eukprot:gene17602-36140_t
MLPPSFLDGWVDGSQRCVDGSQTSAGSTGPLAHNYSCAIPCALCCTQSLHGDSSPP